MALPFDTLHAWMDREGWTAGRLAAAGGWHENTVRRWRSGKRMPNLRDQLRLRTITGLVFDWVSPSITRPVARSGRLPRHRAAPRRDEPREAVAL